MLFRSPDKLRHRFQEELGFYSCTVPSFEQYTLARFLSRGYFEKHINRMRKFYKNRRNAIVAQVAGCAGGARMTMEEQDAGLHFLLRVNTALSDRELTGKLSDRGIRVKALSEYYHDDPGDRHCLVINYSGLREEDLGEALTALCEIM